MTIKGLKSGIELIKEFEGCHLVAYPDPKTKGRPYTIGWGSTRKRDGSPFALGERISQIEADSLFSHQISQEFLPAVKNLPYYSLMEEEMAGAMLSFAYNLGSGFFGAPGFTTISKALRERAWDEVPAALSLYINKGSSVEAGLRRRRKAEGDLWNAGLRKLAPSQPINLEIVALNPTLLKKRPVQSSQLKESEKAEVGVSRGYKIVSREDAEDNHSLVKLDYGAGSWYIYNPHWKVGAVGAGNKPSSSSSGVKHLQAVYFPQWDSDTSHADRMCMSSSVTIAVNYVSPDAIRTNSQEDDYYLLNYVFKHGDTINPLAQVRALKDLGLVAEFRKNLTQQDVINQINRNIPVPVGFLHHGPVSAPRGGGHWICIIGYDLNSKQWIVHDPEGELDVVNGGYFGQRNGANLRYSFKNFNRRWELDSRGRYVPGNGWGIIIHP